MHVWEMAMATADPAASTQVMNGADILVKSLVDNGVEVLFAYPGGASMPLHQALTRFKDKLRTILPQRARRTSMNWQSKLSDEP